MRNFRFEDAAARAVHQADQNLTHDLMAQRTAGPQVEGVEAVGRPQELEREF